MSAFSTPTPAAPPPPQLRSPQLRTMPGRLPGVGDAAPWQLGQKGGSALRDGGGWRDALLRPGIFQVGLLLLLGVAVIAVSALQPPPVARSAPRRSPAPHHALPGAEAVHMVLVCGHAVLTAADQSLISDEASWYLQPAQQGQLSTYLKHIQRGVELAADDPGAVLVFSGGQTRQQAGPRSESLSYWTAADVQGWFGHPDVRGRAVLEEHARDSYENLLFSLCRFREVYGKYPTRVTVVSYSYKRKRFADQHRVAVRFPEAQFVFEGVDPSVNPFDDAVNVRHFAQDPYGCHVNHKLRQERNPFRRSTPYTAAGACPELRRLLHHCGPGLLPARAVPWGHDGKGGGGT